MSRIGPDQLAREAIVYIRQSTPTQMRNNHESRRRQYGLTDRGPQTRVGRASGDRRGSGPGLAAGRFGRASRGCWSPSAKSASASIVLSLEASRRPGLPRRAHRRLRKSARTSVERAYGITSHTPDTADAERLLALNRGHWTVEAVHNILDNAFDEDRCRIRTGPRPRKTTTPPAPPSPSASSVRTPTIASSPPCAASSAIRASSSTTCACPATPSDTGPSRHREVEQISLGTSPLGRARASGATARASASATTRPRPRASGSSPTPGRPPPCANASPNWPPPLDPNPAASADAGASAARRGHRRQAGRGAGGRDRPSGRAVPRRPADRLGGRRSEADGQAARESEARAAAGSVGQGRGTVACVVRSRTVEYRPPTARAPPGGASGRVPGRPPAHGAAAREGLAQGEGDSDGVRRVAGRGVGRRRRVDRRIPPRRPGTSRVLPCQGAGAPPSLRYGPSGDTPRPATWRLVMTGLTGDPDARSSSPSAVPAGTAENPRGSRASQRNTVANSPTPYGIVGAVGLGSVGSILG